MDGKPKLNFVRNDRNDLVLSSKTLNTVRKTESDLKLFLEFLTGIRGETRLPEEIDEKHW